MLKSIHSHNYKHPGNITKIDEMFHKKVYDRGALVLHALRHKVGDNDFFQILKTYVSRYTHKNVTSAGFISVAEEVSEMDLTEFFNNWLYSDNQPPFPE